ncbi:MAG: gamma-glutamyltransferase [Proteobacteria bacterium]|nr:gamma-glutamyltransferase [Pseudomonadota bacterium]
MRDFQLPGRSPAYGRNAMAATSHPLATLAALELLRDGANAVDAAIAAAAVLAVVEPQSTGIGGDCFALLAPEGSDRIVALNGSGRAPRGIDASRLRAQGLDEIGGAHAVTVPGVVDAWARLAADHGSRELGALLQPAIRLAEGGYPVYPRVAFDWAASFEKLAASETAARIFLPEGRAPGAGESHRQPALAQTLKRIAEQGRDGFYRGPVAEEIVACLVEAGGAHSLEDFAAAKADYVSPIKTSYRSMDIYECPPNGQGVVVLVMLNILEGFQLNRLDPLGPERFHLEAEASRLAYRDRDALIGDPSGVPVERLLSKEYAAELRDLIRTERTLEALPPPGFAAHSDTVYLAVVDEKRNAVSFINSIFESFGSGLVAPRSGVLLHNRGACFTLEEGHPNEIGPGKRPLHTIIPAMMAAEGRACMAFGVVGGHFQPVGQVHFLTNLLDYGMDPQGALDLARGFHAEGVFELERGVSEATAQGLAVLGHRIARAEEPLGGGQAIRIDWQSGLLIGGSDPRKDGLALGF